MVKEHFEKLYAELEQQRIDAAEKLERIDHALAEVREALEKETAREEAARRFLDEVMPEDERATARLSFPAGITRREALCIAARAYGWEEV